MKSAMSLVQLIAVMALVLPTQASWGRMTEEDAKALKAEAANTITNEVQNEPIDTQPAAASEDQPTMNADMVAPVPLPRPAFLEGASSTSKSTAATTTTTQKTDSNKLTTPASSVDLTEFDHLDPHHVVPERPFRQALTYLKQNQSKFPNKNYMVVVDFTQPATAERMYIINLKTGDVTRHLTSVGIGSDPHHTGLATSFSNNIGSSKTSLGFYRTAETYKGKHGLSLRLDGLSPTNSNARRRNIVIHSAWYVQEDGKKKKAGHSDGCLALDPDVLKSVVGAIKGGALIYAWAGN